MTSPAKSANQHYPLWFMPTMLCLLMLASAAHAADTVENSIGMQMVRIPAGTFLMGSDATVEQLAADFPGYGTRACKNSTTRHRYTGYYVPVPSTSGSSRSRSGSSGDSWPNRAMFRNRLPMEPARTVTTRITTPPPARVATCFEGRSPKYSWSNPGFPRVTIIRWSPWGKPGFLPQSLVTVRRRRRHADISVLIIRVIAILPLSISNQFRV